MSALIDAIERNDLKRAKYLIEKRAGIHDRDKNGKTALMYAAEKGKDEAVRLLLEKKADVEAQDKTGKTALMYAKINNHLKTICKLINHRIIDPDTQKWLDAQVYEAAYYRNTENIHLLNNAGIWKSEIEQQAQRDREKIEKMIDRNTREAEINAWSGIVARMDHICRNGGNTDKGGYATGRQYNNRVTWAGLVAARKKT